MKNILIIGSSAAFGKEIKKLLRDIVQPPASISILPSGRDPVSEILLSVPQIVITETHLDGISCFEMIQRVIAMGNKATQFVICGERNYEDVYKAWKLGAIDYLPLPVSFESLAAIVTKVSPQMAGQFVEIAARQFYLNDGGMEELRREPMSLEQINAVYSTHFVPGLYRMMFVKFDVPYFHKTSYAKVQLNIDYIEQRLRDTFDQYCADVITIRMADGIMALLNYKPVYASTVDSKSSGLYNQLKYAGDGMKALNITICISNEIDDPCEVWRLKEQVRDAEWARMELGLNKIIRWQDYAQQLDDQKAILLERKQSDVIHAISVLDIDRFRSALHAMFSLPRDFMLSREFRLAVRKVIHAPYELYWDDISKFSDPTKKSDTLAFLSHLCTTFASLETLILTEYTVLLENISKYAENKYSPAVSAVIAYIIHNIDQRVSLASAAAEVNLSECYLSYLFKKETGVNFSKFVSKHKAEAANNMLADTRLTISEIAYRMGFTNVQAFSKHFKSVNGITPSKYRQLHSTASQGKDVPPKNQSDYPMR